MLNVVILRVVMLNVVAPLQHKQRMSLLQNCISSSFIF